jgi:hypothetical protein
MSKIITTVGEFMIKSAIFFGFIAMSLNANAGSASFMSNERTSNGGVLATMDVARHLVNTSRGAECQEDWVSVHLYSNNNTSLEMEFNDTVSSNDNETLLKLTKVGIYSKGVQKATLVVNGNFRKAICLTSDIYASLNSVPLTATLTIQENGKTSVIPLTFPRPE